MTSRNIDFFFTVPGSPTPNASTPILFEVNGVQVSTNVGGLVLTTSQDLQFLTGDEGGGLTSFVPGTLIVINDLLGPQLFTGPTSAPTFRLGSFQLEASGAGSLSGSGTLTISRVMAGAIPEPATWATMLLGFGAVGYSLRRRRAHVQVGRAA